jgi:UrcA family protein
MTSATSRFSNFRRTAALSALGALLIVGASGAAYADDPADAAPTVKVSYGDLNLASAQGNSMLYARIVSAARQVCNSQDVDIRDLQRFSAAQACEANAIAQAVSAAHSPQLAALNSAHLRHG